MRVKSHRLYGFDNRAIDFVKSPNKSSKGLSGGKPKYIIIHYTAGGSTKSAVQTFKNPKSNASAHLVIGHDGEVIQMGKFNEKLWHAGKSKWKGLVGLNSHSVGLEIVNWGMLKGGPGNWKSWVGTSVPDHRVLYERHKNESVKRGWEVYNETQVDSCVHIVRAIADAYGLGPEHVLGHDDISPDRKVDPGPAWDMKRFRAAVFGRVEDGGEQRELYEVAAKSGLNMRKSPEIGDNLIEKLPNGTLLEKVGEEGAWWMVAKMVGGEPDKTGWVHSRWIEEV